MCQARDKWWADKPLPVGASRLPVTRFILKELEKAYSELLKAVRWSSTTRTPERAMLVDRDITDRFRNDISK